MAQSSTIEWTDATWNPVTGCSKVSPGCAHCYAETLTARFAGRKGYIEEHRPWTPENAEHNVRLHEVRLNQPLGWRKPRMVFVNSMSDLFHELVPQEFVWRCFDVMRLAPQHTFQVLTKRPERALEVVSNYYRLTARGIGTPQEAQYSLPNIWLGVSIENARFTWRADILREVPAAVRFISAEPLLGSLFESRSHAPRGGVEGATGIITHRPLDLTGIDWLIVGGESGGRDARPMHPEWARELRDACKYDFDHPDVAFFFKQWGSWVPQDGPLEIGDICVSDDGQRYRVDEDYVCAPNESDGTWMRYAGSSPKSGGRELDGRTWDEMPNVALSGDSL